MILDTPNVRGSVATPQQLAQFAQDVAGALAGPLHTVSFTYNAQVSHTRKIRVQITARTGQPVRLPRLLEAWAGSAAGPGTAPSASNPSITVATGVAVGSDSSGSIRAMTNEQGFAEFNVTRSTAGTVYVAVVCEGVVWFSDAIPFA